MTTGAQLDELSINTIRTLSMDAVEKAKSGHPGAPMALAPLAYLLYTRVMKHNPANSEWFDRDRFILSAGHASMLLYSSLYLSGYGLTLEDLENFRQLGSPTAGHPERRVAAGVEATTGPLGQGLSMSVGLALAEAMLASRFNRSGHDLIDHRTWVIASDGDIQEGVASEASSLAGHLGLGKLTVFYDNNHIQLAGKTAMAFSEDVPKRYEAYGWHVQDLGEEISLGDMERAIETAEGVADQPSLIVLRTHIGYGSPNKQDSYKAHGSPLGEDEVRATKEAYGWDPDAHFLVPDEVRAYMRSFADRGNELVSAWHDAFEAYRRADGDTAGELQRRLGRRLRGDALGGLKTYAVGEELATRQASQQAIQALAGPVPELFGGAADLSESNLTDIKGAGDFEDGDPGRNLRFGVREHGMGGIANGLAYHGGFIPYAGTFLNFSDYMRGSVRLA